MIMQMLVEQVDYSPHLTKLSTQQQKLLKVFHTLFASLWLGGAMGLVIFQYFLSINDEASLYGVTISVQFLDNFVIIPGAVGTIATGFIYSLWTKWGVVKHRWIVMKWAIAMIGVFLGTFFLSPWANALPSLARAQKMSALANPEFTSMMTGLGFWGAVQLVLMIIAVVISILKPWKTKSIRAR